MKRFKWILPFLTVCLSTSSNASANIVGYYNLSISPGDNLIANQFTLSPEDNTLDNVLTNGVASGSTFSEWDPVANHLLPLSIYSGGAWSINYTLAPDSVGGVLNSPSATTATFVGTEVNIGALDSYTFTPPAYGPGTYLLALAAVLPGGTFQEIVGRAPEIGDSVRTLNAATQVYSTTTFDGSAWNNGVPSLAIGQAAYFNLGAVPEPSTLALAGLGAAALGILRRRNSRT